MTIGRTCTYLLILLLPPCSRCLAGEVSPVGNSEVYRLIQQLDSDDWVLQGESLDVPHFYLRPERALLDAIGSLLGGQDIDFSQDAAFSDAYVLQGDDEAGIRELFDADVRSYFAQRVADSFHFEARGNTLAFRTNRRRDPNEATELMRQALEIAAVLAKQ